MSRPHPPADPATVARNFIQHYGKGRFKRFLKMLQAGTSGEVIADEYGVSRERVRQWKNVFGSIVMTYDVLPEVAKLAGLRRNP